LAIFVAPQRDGDLGGSACLAQGGRGFVDEGSLFGCGGKFVFFCADEFFEGFDFFVAGSGVAFGPFGGAVERVDAGADRLEVEQAAAQLREVGRITAE
jgi:hypothetical protein